MTETTPLLWAVVEDMIDDHPGLWLNGIGSYVEHGHLQDPYEDLDTEVGEAVRAAVSAVEYVP